MSRILNALSGGSIPRFAFPALTAFAQQHEDVANSLMGGRPVAAPRFARELMLRIERLLREGSRNAALLSTVEAVRTLLDGPLRNTFLDALASDAADASSARLAAGRIRSLWGTTPIINIIPAACADRRLGTEAETLVFTTYHVTSDFDIVLKQQQAWLFEDYPHLYYAYPWTVFIWALVAYDVFFYFNDRGIVVPPGGYGSERFGINIEEMRLLRLARKRFYTLAYGADHRLRQRTLASSTFNFCMHCPAPGSFCVCDDDAGVRILETIREYATGMLAFGLALDNIPHARELHYLVLDVARFEPSYPAPQGDKALRVLHAPNHPYFKGTHYLEAAVEKLQKEGHRIELVMPSGLDNAELMELVRGVDVVADQFIGGAYGYAAVEAMALGKPVLCYVRVADRFPAPATLPIINASPDELYDTLRHIAENRHLLPEIGRRSRKYVERHHSLEAFSESLRVLYLETAGFPPRVNQVLARPGPAERMLQTIRFSTAAIARYRVSSHRAVRHLVTRAGAMAQLTRLRSEGFAKWAYAAARAAAYRVCYPLLVIVTKARQRAFRALVIVVTAAWKTIVIPVLVSLGRATTRRRMHAGRPRSLWGITPILTLPLLARCDRQLGLESASLVFTTYHIHSQFDINLKRSADWVVSHVPMLYLPYTWLVLAYALLRYDVFHFFCDRGILPPTGRMGLRKSELEVLKRAGKLLFTYTYGADVRTRHATLDLGKFNFCMDCPEPPKYCVCNDALGAANIETIARYATRMVAMGDMKAYVPGAFEIPFWPLDTEAIGYVGTRLQAGRPMRVAHAPNHPHFKGTSYILSAIERLNSEGIAIELVRIQGVPNTEVLRLFAGVDIVVEQLIGGFHGYTALEAMALGKPVITYLRGPDMVVAPDECPIINANPDTIYDVLKACAAGDYDLQAIGRRSRAYVERYYSRSAVSAALGAMYVSTDRLPTRLNEQLRDRIAALRENALKRAESVPA